jgi:hypothetical protein
MRRNDNMFGNLFEVGEMSLKNNCSVHATCMTQQLLSDMYIVKIY